MQCPVMVIRPEGFMQTFRKEYASGNDCWYLQKAYLEMSGTESEIRIGGKGIRILRQQPHAFTLLQNFLRFRRSILPGSRFLPLFPMHSHY